ncbi:MAG: acyl-CoA dehydrogenase family protein [Actinomycetota bacterium]|nr:acyl-CoA dehydrogenase family protein [Actinomycetota bacterium]
MWRLTDAQRELREHIRTVVLDEIRPATLDFGESTEYPQDVFDVLAREGLLRLGIPQEHGGRADESNVSFCPYGEA